MNDFQRHRIPKTHIVAIKQPRATFEIPKTNRFFQKITCNKGVLSHSQNNQDESDKESKTFQDNNEPTLNKSSSIHLSRKSSHIRPQKCIRQIQSLPKIQKKIPQVMREIIKSELGCFSYFQIVRKMEEEKEKQKQVGKNHLTHLSSFLSEDQGLNQEIVEKKDETDTSKYEEYDNNLIKSQPVIYRRRYFKLKHKEEWCISNG